MPSTITESDLEAQLHMQEEFYRMIGSPIGPINRFDIPAPPKQLFDDPLLLVVPESLNIKSRPIERVLEVCSSRFPVRATHFNEMEWQHTRDPRNGTYALWVENTPEPDARHALMSSEDLRVGKWPVNTLLEGILLHLFSVTQGRGHWNTEFINLCAGTERRGPAVAKSSKGEAEQGRTIGIDFKIGEMIVCGYPEGSRLKYLRAREVYF